MNFGFKTYDKFLDYMIVLLKYHFKTERRFDGHRLEWLLRTYSYDDRRVCIMI